MTSGGVFLSDDVIRHPARTAALGRLGTLCRLGLATRGNTSLEREDVEEAIRRGVGYRFVLCHAAVAVALMAPDGRAEFEENLEILEAWEGDDAGALRGAARARRARPTARRAVSVSLSLTAAFAFGVIFQGVDLLAGQSAR